jgi:hypothetical protein
MSCIVSLFFGDSHPATCTTPATIKVFWWGAGLINMSCLVLYVVPVPSRGFHSGPAYPFYLRMAIEVVKVELTGRQTTVSDRDNLLINKSNITNYEASDNESSLRQE